MTIVRTGMALLTVATALALWPSEASAQKRRRDVITGDEIVQSPVKSANLYTAISSLRPHFLTASRGVRTLGNSIIEPLAVYINGARQTDVDALKSIQAAAVEEVRFLNPTEAGNQFGPKASGGALVIRLRKPSDGPAPSPPVTPPPVTAG